MNSILWIIVLGILIFIEILTLRYTTIWFAGGALTAFVVSLYIDSLPLEIILFFVVSISLLYFTRPMIHSHVNQQKTETYDEALIGKEATVLNTIDNNNTDGQVEIEGQRWSARSLQGDVIEIGNRVIIKGFSESKLIVSIIQKD